MDLPDIQLTGDWNPTPAERTLAARMLPTLPPAPPPGADIVTRWNQLASTLQAVSGGMLADPDSLWAGKTSHETPIGQLDMHLMPHNLMQVLSSQSHVIQWVNDGRPEGHQLLASVLDRMEPQVAQLRTLIAEVAG